MQIRTSLNINSMQYRTMLIIALILSFTPIIKSTFFWLTNFFHEISHGIMAILTGGNIQKIEMLFFGHSTFYVDGGNQVLILSSGYIGAVIFGTLIYNIAKKGINLSILSFSLILSFILIALFLTEDLMSKLILIILATKIFFIYKVKNYYLQKFMFRFIAIYILVDGAKSSLSLIDGRNFGDAYELEAITNIPEIFWSLSWFCINIIILIIHYNSEMKESRNIHNMKEVN